MKKLDIDDVYQSMVNLEKFQIDYIDGKFNPEQKILQFVAKQLTEKTGYIVFYGAGDLLSRNKINLIDGVEKIYSLYEFIFERALTLIDLDKYNVINRDMIIGKMDVDGYNLNQNFSHDGKIAERAFMTTKCAHFDTSTPFVANIYGPNKNIQGGFPVICDMKQYCQAQALIPKELVINIENNYNMAIKEEYYHDALRDYGFALDMDFTNDIVMIMLTNEIEFGVAHGATTPYKTKLSEEACRPIRHLEFQYTSEAHYDEWLEYYNLELSEVSDHHEGINLSLDFYNKAFNFSENVIKIA